MTHANNEFTDLYNMLVDPVQLLRSIHAWLQITSDYFTFHRSKSVHVNVHIHNSSFFHPLPTQTRRTSELSLCGAI